MLSRCVDTLPSCGLLPRLIVALFHSFHFLVFLQPSLTATTSLLVGSGESFPSFMHRLHKSAHLLAAELFGTQLRMIRGVSAPLALTLLEKYPSVRALCEAYEACPSVEAEEQMLAEVPRGKFQ